LKFDFVAIDFETANNNYSSACSMGIAAVKDNVIIETSHYLIQPPNNKFNEINISIHGITPDDVKNAPFFPEVWEEIKSYFQNEIIAAHNAIFDMSVLKNCSIEYDLEIPNFKYICSIPFSTCACDDVTSGRSLESRANYFGVDLGHHHNALDDSKACANLIIECIKLRKIKSFQSYLDIYNHINVKDFSDLKPQSVFKKEHVKFNRIAISEISATNTVNNNSILYGKNIVFTGELQTIDRKEAMQKVVNLGAIIKSGVSHKTDYLVVGVQDKSIVGEDGMSTKEAKAYELIDKGENIKVLNEIDFFKMATLLNDDMLNSMILFDSINNKMEKMKEWNLLSPKSKEMKDIYYKNDAATYICEIVGYYSKITNNKCIDGFYETIVIEFDNTIIKIAPGYLFEMQKKDFIKSIGELSE
jgi:DNA polymerase-3 subunit epsilon